MKKVLGVFVMVLVFNLSNAQKVKLDTIENVVNVATGTPIIPLSWHNDFPHGEIEKIVGKRIKGDTLSAGLQKYGFSNLYKSESMKHNQIWKENSSYATKYEAVVNKIFTIVSATSYIGYANAKKFKVKLLSENGETVWMEYDERYSHGFNFLIEGGFRVSDEYYCSVFVSQSYDEFDDEYTYRSEASEGYKLIRVGNTYYLKIVAGANTTGGIGAKGVQLILLDGQRLSWPDTDLDTKVNPSNNSWDKDYLVSCFIKLSQEDLRKLSTSNPRKAKLYIFKRNFGEVDWARSFRCVMDK